MFYAVIDTNVIVSAMLTKNKEAATVKIIEKVFDGTIKPLLHAEIISGYKDVLSRKEFPFKTETIQQVVKAMQDNGIFLDGISADEPVADPKDVIFYEIALDARRATDAYLVTGNIKDFPRKPFVVTPREMLEIIERNK